MKKTDILTWTGLIFGTIMLIWGMLMGGSSIKTFVDPSSVVITVGGSFCALLVTYTVSDLKNMGPLFIQSLKMNNKSGQDIILKFTELSKKARKEGLLSLEDEIAEIDDDFLKKGLQMVVDGIEPETIKNIMELEIDEMERRHSEGAAIFKSWGGYAPAFGMLGTLIGLIQMLAADLTDTSIIASGMAKALITTYYGSIMASLILNPISMNLMTKSEKESAIREMMLEGILSIQSGVNPRIVEEKLVSYLSSKERISYKKLSVEAGGMEVGDV